MYSHVKIAVNFFKDNDYFCFLCHKGLDGDTIGAAFALFYALQQMNKKSVIKTFEDEFLEKFSFIYPEDAMKENFEVKNYVTVDVADLKLVEERFWNENIALCIDHHKSNNIKADFMCVDYKLAASCELVYLILKELPIKITPKIADCLYLGISTDTGCFKYDNVSYKTHLVAADLIEKGANFSRINFDMFDRKTKTRLNLEKEILGSMEYFFEDRVVVVFITDDMVKKVGATKEDCSAVAHIVAGCDSVFFAITAKQEGEFFKISVRTKENYDASLFCKKFGGGGHKKAAGCLIKGTKKEVLEKLLIELKEDLKF